MKLLFLLLLTAAGDFTPASAQFLQQGPKLVGTGNSGPASQGSAVAVSADGNTAVVGAVGDGRPAGTSGFGVGAAWVFARTGATWSQQGPKLLGSNAVGLSEQGGAVAISGDGNTVLVSGFTDNSEQGAIWVYTRSGGVWGQQGSKLTAAGAHRLGERIALSADGNTVVAGQFGRAYVFTRTGGSWTLQSVLTAPGGSTDFFGSQMAISGDGNTIAVSDYYDSNLKGAVYVFTRAGSQWAQQGSKLAGSGAAGSAMGYSLALSATGDTLIAGAPFDQSNLGAAWVFTRSGGVWREEKKLVFEELSIAPIFFGEAVSLSADGNTAAVNGFFSSASIHGGLWIFNRVGNVWKQLGRSLIGSDVTATTTMCCAIALSADGDTVIAGGPGDNAPDLNNPGPGATWVFVRERLRVSAPATAIAGVPFPVTVTATLPNSVAVGTANGPIQLASTDVKAQLAQSASLAAGVVTFTAALNTPGPQTITATDVTTPGIQGTSAFITVTRPAITASPSTLQMEYTQGTRPVAATVRITSEAALGFTASAADSWLTVSPTSGTAPATLTVTPDGALAPGAHASSLLVTFEDGRTVNVPVKVTTLAGVSIGSFANGASFLMAGAAPNSVFSLFGNFANCGPELKVTVDGAETTVYGFGAAQVNFLVPGEVDGKGSVVVAVACAGASSQIVLPVLAAAPALFTAAQNGKGRAAAVYEDGGVPGPARRGSVVSLYGTGFGPLAAGPDGLRRAKIEVMATIGGLPAKVLYAGEAPGLTLGLQQINVIVPDGVPAGDAAVELTAGPAVGGTRTQPGVTLPVE